MKNFNNFLNEMSYEDIFKRNNKQTFIDKAVTGELITSDGKKLPKIKGIKEILYPGEGMNARYKRNA